MALLPIRARIAPIALLVAFGFVVAGFLRADREMSAAEQDRAALVVSETATLVEVFLLRHIAQLHVVERAIDRPNNRAEERTSRSLSTFLQDSSQAFVSFDALAVLDSALTIRESTAVPDSSASAETISLPPAVIEQIRMGEKKTERHPAVITSSENGRPVLWFIEPLQNHRDFVLIGSTTADSLSTLLSRQRRTLSYNIVVRSASDTVLAVVRHSSGNTTRRVQQSVDASLGLHWTVEMTYAPAGRGVRIALWVVGLGAIVGLGIGLLLERREASRIADRSSELEHLSTELLRANRAKSEFLANVSHELRTPLNAIVGFVDLLRDGVYGTLNSRQVGPVERIEASATHLRHLVDQVLDLAKMAAGRLEVHSEPVELRPFVFDVASEVEPLITEKGLSFSLAVGATLPRVRTDPTHLRQILINLLGNAVKFTNTGGISVRGRLIGSDDNSPTVAQAGLSNATQLTQSPRPDGFWIALQVADSGMGIPEKDRERIFDEFEQVNAGPRGDSMRRGTGLGLSISRRLARLLGGDITVESELGRGSVFTVWIPVDPADLRGDRAA